MAQTTFLETEEQRQLLKRMQRTMELVDPKGAATEEASPPPKDPQVESRIRALVDSQNEVRKRQPQTPILFPHTEKDLETRGTGVRGTRFQRPSTPPPSSLADINQHAAATGGDYGMNGRPDAIIPPPVRPDAMRTRRPNEQDPKNFRQAPPQILTESGMEDPPAVHNPELPKLPTIDLQPSAPAAPAGKLTPDEQYAQALRRHAKLLQAHKLKVEMAMKRGGYDQSDPDMRPPVLPRPPANAFKNAPKQGPRTLDQSAKENQVQTERRTKMVPDATAPGGIKEEVVHDVGDIDNNAAAPSGPNSEIGISRAKAEAFYRGHDDAADNGRLTGFHEGGRRFYVDENGRTFTEPLDEDETADRTRQLVLDRETERQLAQQGPKLPNTPAGREAAKYEDMVGFANNATIDTRPREEPRQLEATDKFGKPILGKDGKPVGEQQFTTRDKDLQPPSRAPYKHAGNGPTRGAEPAAAPQSPAARLVERVREARGVATNAARFSDPAKQAGFDEWQKADREAGQRRVAELDARRAAEEYVEPTDEFGAPAGSEEARKNRFNSAAAERRLGDVRRGDTHSEEHNAAIEGAPRSGEPPMRARNDKGTVKMGEPAVISDDQMQGANAAQRQHMEGRVGIPGGGHDPLHPELGTDVWRTRAMDPAEHQDLAAMADDDRYSVLADRLAIDPNLSNGRRMQLAKNYWNNQLRLGETHTVEKAPGGGHYFAPNADLRKQRGTNDLKREASRVIGAYPFKPQGPGKEPDISHHDALRVAARAGDGETVRAITQQLRDARQSSTAMTLRQRGLDAGAVQNMNNPRIAQAMFNREVKENEGNPEGMAGVYRRWNRPDLAERVEQLGIARQGVDHQADLDAAKIRNEGLAAQGVNLQGQAAVIDAKAKAGQPPKPTGSGEQAELNTRPSIQGVQGTTPRFGSFGAGFNNYMLASGSEGRAATEDDQHRYFSLIYADATKGRPTNMTELNSNHPVIGTALIQLARKIYEGTGAGSRIPNMRDAEEDGAFLDSEKTIFFKQLQEKLGVGPEIASQLWSDLYKRPAPKPKEENA